MTAPVKKAWTSISRRIARRKAGLVKLRKDVRTCEYEDVHIIWDLLKRNDSNVTRARDQGTLHDFALWAKHAPLTRHRG